MKIIHCLRWSIGFFILAAAFSVAAQNTVSYTLMIPPGASLLANQLNIGANTANLIFSNTVGGISELDGDELFGTVGCGGDTFSMIVFDSTLSTGFSDGYYDIAHLPAQPPSMAPGVGFIFYNLSDTTVLVNLAGSPNIPVLPVKLACGEGSYYLLGRQTNDIGTYENVTGYAPTEGSQVKTILPSGEAYITNFYTGGAWTLGTPSLAVNQAAFFFIPAGSMAAVPVAPTLGDISHNEPGAVQFPIRGTVGESFRVWATTNLALTPVTNTWTLVDSDTFTNIPAVYTDAAAVNYSQRFYRVTVP